MVLTLLDHNADPNQYGEAYPFEPECLNLTPASLSDDTYLLWTH